MGITVQHQPDFKGVGAAAYATGKGDYNRWLSDQRQQDASRITQAKMQAVQIAAAKAARRDALKEAKRREDAQRKDRRWELERQSQVQSAQREMAYQRQLNLDQSRRSGEDKQWEHRYSVQQKQKLSQYNDAMQTVRDMVERKKLTKEEGAYATQQIEFAKAGIKPMKFPRERKGVTFEELEKQGRYNVNPDGSTRWINPDGTIGHRPPAVNKEAERLWEEQYKEKEFKQKQKKDLADYADRMVERAGYDDDGQPLKSYKEAMRLAHEYYEIPQPEVPGDLDVGGQRGDDQRQVQQTFETNYKALKQDYPKEHKPAYGEKTKLDSILKMYAAQTAAGMDPVQGRKLWKSLLIEANLSEIRYPFPHEDEYERFLLKERMAWGTSASESKRSGLNHPAFGYEDAYQQMLYQQHGNQVFPAPQERVGPVWQEGPMLY